MGNLKKHVSIVHEGLRPYQCDICEKSYAENRDLKNHYKIVHDGTKSYFCDLCGKTFNLPKY